MSEPTSPDDGSVGPPEHLHPLFLLTGLGGSLRGMAGGYALIGYLIVSGKWGTALFAMLALLLFMAIGIFLYWRRFEFRVGPLRQRQFHDGKPGRGNPRFMPWPIQS